MTINQPLVTIGVASFNNASYLCETLDSIRNQTYHNIELIIVDDASKDNSVKIAEHWLVEHPEVNGRIIRHATNQGICCVCNDFVSEAKGEFIGMIGSDDLYKNYMIASSLAELQQRGKQYGAVYGDCEIIDKIGEVVSSSFLTHFDARFGPAYPQGDIRIQLLSGFYLPAPTVLMRREALIQAGPYDESLKAEDLDMWLRLCMRWKFAFLPQVVSAYRVHQLSATQVNRVGLNETFFRIYQKTKFTLGPESEAAKRMLAESMEHYFASNGNDAVAKLWYAFTETKMPKIAFFWALAKLGISYKVVRKLLSFGPRR